MEDAGAVVLLQRNLANQWPQVSSVESLGQAVEFGTWPSLLATLAIMPLLRAPRQRVERPWVWLIVTALAVAIMTPNPLNGWTHGQQRPILVGVLVAAALLGVVIDLRIPVVASALTLVPTLALLASELLRWKGGYWEFDNHSLALAALAGLLATALTVTMVTARRATAL